MAGGAYSKEQLALLLEGVSRIFNGFIVGLVLGVIFAIAYVALTLSSDGSAEAFIHGLGILIIVLGVLAFPINYYFLYGGLVYLSRADRGKYGIGAWGGLGLLVLDSVLIIYGVYLIASRISLTTFLMTAVPIAVVGLIIQVLMYAALYRLGDDFGVGYLTTGVIILLFATVLSAIPLINVVGGILGLVGFVLMLVGLNEVKNKIEPQIMPK
ncbi:hypothetical protein [Vulcanisaeta sp. JCM 14467]|uniref:hypothetical protein n=1 Tax=Vulcanisaeta sp. JCM 14467 TaxID=1295370 RepID=UPI0006D295EC|nr:hypothetical protein [Vulcanisaeta sp. JCM 14467]